MRLWEYLDEVSPKPPFWLCVPALVLDKMDSENRARGCVTCSLVYFWVG